MKRQQKFIESLNPTDFLPTLGERAVVLKQIFTKRQRIIAGKASSFPVIMVSQIDLVLCCSKTGPIII